MFVCHRYTKNTNTSVIAYGSVLLDELASIFKQINQSLWVAAALDNGILHHWYNNCVPNTHGICSGKPNTRYALSGNFKKENAPARSLRVCFVKDLELIVWERTIYPCRNSRSEYEKNVDYLAEEETGQCKPCTLTLRVNIDFWTQHLCTRIITCLWKKTAAINN